MTFHPYLYEKLIAIRHEEIQHDMQQSRLRASAGQRRTFVRYAARRLGTLLVELGSQLQRREGWERMSKRNAVERGMGAYVERNAVEPT